MLYLLACLVACPSPSAEARPPGPHLDDVSPVTSEAQRFDPPDWNPGDPLVAASTPIPTEPPPPAVAPVDVTPDTAAAYAPPAGAKAEREAALQATASALGPAILP